MEFHSYVGDIMQNHPLSSDSALSVNNSNQYGGNSNNSNNSNKPNGGFPPIILCKDFKDDNNMDDDDKKTRHYVTQKDTVSIKDIIDKRRTITPFITLN